MENTKFCKHCGEVIDVDCVVCPKCGKQVEQLNSGKDTPIIINNSSSSSSGASAAASVAGGVIEGHYHGILSGFGFFFLDVLLAEFIGLLDSF